MKYVTILTTILFALLPWITTAQAICTPITPSQWEYDQGADGRPPTIRLYFYLPDGTFVDGMSISQHPAVHWITGADSEQETVHCVSEYQNFIDYTLSQLNTQAPAQAQYPAEYNQFLRSINPYTIYLPVINTAGETPETRATADPAARPDILAEP